MSAGARNEQGGDARLPRNSGAPIEGYSLLKAELSYAHMFSDTRSGHHAIMVGLAGGNLLNPAIGNDIFVQDGKGSAEWFLRPAFYRSAIAQTKKSGIVPFLARFTVSDGDKNIAVHYSQNEHVSGAESRCRDVSIAGCFLRIFIAGFRAGRRDSTAGSFLQDTTSGNKSSGIEQMSAANTI